MRIAPFHRTGSSNCNEPEAHLDVPMKSSRRAGSPPYTTTTADLNLTPPARFSHGPGRLGTLGRPLLLLTCMWALGLIAVGVVIRFQAEVDESRHAQVVVEQLRNQQDALLAIAFNPATSGNGEAPLRGETLAELTRTEGLIDANISLLARLGNRATYDSIAAASKDHYRFVGHLSTLVFSGASRQAALELGKSDKRGVEAHLSDQLSDADAVYGAAAARARLVSWIGTLAAMTFLLVAFSIVFTQSVRARRRSNHEATTDALTGLGNRRALFADMEVAVNSLGERESLVVGIFDLDGFKAYNDTFGHPAGDALLARLGYKLALSVAEHGRAYRIGGDEFIVVTTPDGGESTLSAAQVALSERGEGFLISCSRGSSRINVGHSLEDALHAADQLLYTNKHSLRVDERSEAKDALLQVLAEQNQDLVIHLGHVAELAGDTAQRLGLGPEQIIRTRLAAELHDVGKAAIPGSILNKPGPLNPAERSLMELHTVIGERILTAAPTLAVIAEIVRASHERPDGTGYPDGLSLEQIPICSQIIAVVDAFDAMPRHRPYRDAMPVASALAELHRHAGTQFAPRVVEALLSALADRPARRAVESGTVALV
jgi:diguanylate cyclase (GGDEF)-like protein